MHSSAFRVGSKFLANYWHEGMDTILEIGSYDVNGSLRASQPQASTWIGVDIEVGPGVDQVVEIGKPLPFPDSSFDIIIATSVFEHDPSFWKTLADMARLIKKSGHIYVSAPSNGMVHRFPLDCFRFYPDASISFLNIIREVKEGASLSESFIGDQDDEGLWNDFVAIFSMSSARPPRELVSNTEGHTNLWLNGNFRDSTLVEVPEDRRNADFRAEQIALLQAENNLLQSENNRLSTDLEAIRQSRSWKLTAPLRGFPKQ
jgi:SAM-dependent methyltransferase